MKSKLKRQAMAEVRISAGLNNTKRPDRIPYFLRLVQVYRNCYGESTFLNKSWDKILNSLKK